MLLPLPLSPASATISRSPMARLMSSTACSVRRDSVLPILKCLVSASVLSSGAVPPGSTVASAGCPPWSVTGRPPSAYSRHRTCVPADLVQARGSARRRRSCTFGQRGANRQPAGGLARSGGLPGIPLSGTRGPLIDGNASSRPALYGCSGESKTRRVAPSSATWPAYITISRSEKWLTSDMSWVTKMTAKPNSRCSSLIWTISERCATTSSADVGSSMITRSGVNSMAMAIIERCRMPPDSWCG